MTSGLTNWTQRDKDMMSTLLAEQLPRWKADDEMMDGIRAAAELAGLKCDEDSLVRYTIVMGAAWHGGGGS